MNRVWVLTMDINCLIAIWWPKKPTLRQLKALLPNIPWDSIKILSYKRHLTDSSNAKYTLTHHKYGAKF